MLLLSFCRDLCTIFSRFGIYQKFSRFHKNQNFGTFSTLVWAHFWTKLGKIRSVQTLEKSYLDYQFAQKNVVLFHKFDFPSWTNSYLVRPTENEKL